MRAQWIRVIAASLLCGGLLFVPGAQVRGERLVPVSTGAQANALDINTASAAELRALPGMGDNYVRRILANRPYTAKNQLVTRGVLPQAAYERIRDRIVAHRPPR